jgi:hypothetical protein
MGVEVEDPTDSHREYKKGEYEGDPVQKIYGFTGFRRRFRFEITGGQKRQFERRYELPNPPIKPNPRTERQPSWQFRSSAWHGNLEILLVGAKPEDFAIIQGALAFASAVGALGAKSQHGCGIVQYHIADVSRNAFLQWLNQLWQGEGGAVEMSDLPSLRNLFVGEFTANGDRRLTDLDTFYARYYMREALRPHASSSKDEEDAARTLRHSILGTLGRDRQGSKVCVSFPFDCGNTSRLRVWGWIPEVPVPRATRLGCLNTIRDAMSAHFHEENWLDLASWYPSSVLDRIDETLKIGVPWDSK